MPARRGGISVYSVYSVDSSFVFIRVHSWFQFNVWVRLDRSKLFDVKHHFQPLGVVHVKAEFCIKWNFVRLRAQFDKNICAAYSVVVDELQQFID